MKSIEKNQLEKLLEIIMPAPALRIAHFSEAGEEMIEVLSHFCQQREYEYQINCTNSNFFDTILNKFKEVEAVQPINFTLERPRYMLQGKLYEYLFVTSTIPKKVRSDFLKKCHHIIKNAGYILIFLPKGDDEVRYHWMELLEEHYYVASNTIDNLFEHYDLLISKKMHGWGG